MIKINQYLEITKDGKEIEYAEGFRLIRRKMSMTRPEMGAALGVSPRYCESIEQGRRQPGLMVMVYLKKLFENNNK